MEAEFDGHCYVIAEKLESEAFSASLVFPDSWYFLEYRFFRRDCISSEVSAVIRTHLYNLAAVLYRDYEKLVESGTFDSTSIRSVIHEIDAICEFTLKHPVCLWIYGDPTSREFLDEWLAKMPTDAQVVHFLNLPHMSQHELERLPYRHQADKVAMKRFRNEVAAFNRRQKIEAKNQQRAKTSMKGAGGDS